MEISPGQPGRPSDLLIPGPRLTPQTDNANIDFAAKCKQVVPPGTVNLGVPSDLEDNTWDGP